MEGRGLQEGSHSSRGQLGKAASFSELLQGWGMKQAILKGEVGGGERRLLSEAGAMTRTEQDGQEAGRKTDR